MNTESPGTAGRAQAVVLSRLQRAWLTELGLDPVLLPGTTQPTAVPAAARRSGPADIEKRRLPKAEVQDQVRPPAEVLAHAPTYTGPADAASLHERVQACRACGLYAGRHMAVVGAGDTQAPEWLIVGEAPAREDDACGLPFQGEAGRLLHAMLLALGVHPQSATLGPEPRIQTAWSQPCSMYFAQLVKCRPPANRAPTHAEATACKAFLDEQIELLQPRRILALGRLAAQTLLQVSDELDALRGRLHYVSTPQGQRIPLVVSWHPAALLMQPQKKAQAWADLHVAQAALGPATD